MTQVSQAGALSLPRHHNSACPPLRFKSPNANYDPPAGPFVDSSENEALPGAGGAFTSVGVGQRWEDHPAKAAIS